MYAVVMFLHAVGECNGGGRGRIRGIESLSQANLENVSLRAEQKEATRNIVVLKKDTLIILPTGFGKSLIFQFIFALCF